ncbi:MAG: hypothetical protein J2P41_00155 [Blastocatellia bacterium]|nr:hypothetical protein [Blastocatellia bacterium]
MPRPKSKAPALLRRRKTIPTDEMPQVELEEVSEQPQVIEVKHKTEWSEMRPVEEAPDQDLIFDDETESRPKRKVNSERDEIRKKLGRAGITPGSQLKLTIERYLHSDAVDGQGGMFAETEHCTKYVCAEGHITSEDYLDVARRFGPGLYRFTLRLKNTIVTAWDKRISPATPTFQHINPTDPNSPQVIVNMPEGANGQQPVGVLDPMKQMRELAKTYKEMKIAFEGEGAQAPAAAAPTDPKIAALQLISENPEVMEKIGSGIAKTVLGAKGAGDSDPWADVAMEAIKSGQAAEIAATIIREIMAPFRNMNGQAQAPQPPPPPVMPAPQVVPQNGEPQRVVNPPPQAPRPRPAQEQPAQATQNVTPADALMLALIDAMNRNAPLKEAQSIINVAVYRNPELDESIDELLNLSTDELMNLLKAYHPKVDEIPHAKEWLESLTGSLAQGEQLEAAE